MLFNILSCESSKNFNIFSSQKVSEREIKEEQVLESKKEQSSFKNDSNSNVSKRKKTKKVFRMDYGINVSLVMKLFIAQN